MTPAVVSVRPYPLPGSTFAPKSASIQDTLGWVLVPDYTDGRVELAFTDSAGLPVTVQGLQVLIGRTTEAADDLRPEFAQAGAVYAADVPLTRGKWMIKVTAIAEDGTHFEQRTDFYVKG